MVKRIIYITLSVLFVLQLMSCGGNDATGSFSGKPEEVSLADYFGEYSYPEDPVVDLKEFLEKDFDERNLSFSLGETQRITDDEYLDRIEFTINFKDQTSNVCMVSFKVAKDGSVLDVGSVDGNDNPSFTVAFENPYEADCLVDILTSVILYVSPDISAEEASLIAASQDESISIDGYSTPRDIGGYQLQAHYTNPHVFFSTTNFVSRYGFTVTALKQIWGGKINLSSYKELVEKEDYLELTKQASQGFDENEKVYFRAEFTVKNWWESKRKPISETRTNVTAESSFGEKYELYLYTSKTPYQFSIGEKYVLFGCLDNSTPNDIPQITYAVHIPEGENE